MTAFLPVPAGSTAAKALVHRGGDHEVAYAAGSDFQTRPPWGIPLVNETLQQAVANYASTRRAVGPSLAAWLLLDA
eukprot:5995915-Prymnesium_polylepis.1